MPSLNLCLKIEPRWAAKPSMLALLEAKNWQNLIFKLKKIPGWMLARSLENDMMSLSLIPKIWI